MDDLTHLCSAYFYEFWDEYEYDSWQAAVDDFAHRSPERVAGAAAAVRALLDEPLTDEQLDTRLRGLGCTFVSEDGDRRWLVQLFDRLRSASAGKVSEQGQLTTSPAPIHREGKAAAMTSAVVEHLVAEAEEEYAFNGVLPLYMFAWSLAGLGHDRSESGFEELCQEAYWQFTDKHPEARLVELPWPIDVGRAKPMGSDADLQLDLDPDAPPSTWLQALIRSVRVTG